LEYFASVPAMAVLGPPAPAGVAEWSQHGSAYSESGQGVHRHRGAGRGGPGAPCVGWCERQHSPAGSG